MFWDYLLHYNYPNVVSLVNFYLIGSDTLEVIDVVRLIFITIGYGKIYQLLRLHSSH